MTVITEFEGLSDAAVYFERMPDVSRRSARLAINTVLARSGMKLVTDEMYSQVNFPKGYLNGDRLRVSKRATETNLEGSIIGRKRATSLARFAETRAIGRQPGTLKVTVRNGRSTYLRNAWLVRLRKGKSLTEDQFNVGLAVRVKPGDTLGNKKSAHQAWLNPQKTVALLYGPSVDQVFRDVAEDKGSDILNLVSREFFRQFDRLS